MEKAPTQCKYFLHGACSRGSTCIYVHDLNAKKDNVCKFYATGNCSYGKNCRYDHVKPITKVRKPVEQVLEVQQKKTVSTLVPLGKKCVITDTTGDWLNAPDFIPGKKVHRTIELKEESVLKDVSYSQMASFMSDQVEEQEENLNTYEGDSILLLCPFAAVRECPFGDDCEYLHGDVCEMCGCQCLHPTNEQQRKDHELECTERHEAEMKIAFAAQRSDGVACSVCLDVVKNKVDITERLFGLLENCNHPFCLSCIRKWRISYHLEKTVVRTCPICRVQSWFITPSEFWIEDANEKRDVIENYKQHLGTKHCRLFDQGRGECPFGTSCFYKHAFPDGTIDDRKPDLRYVEDSLGNLSVVTAPRLNQFIDERDTN